MKGIWRVASWRGVPVYVSWTVLLSVPFLMVFGHSLRSALLALPGYLFLIVLHEAGHAWVAQRLRVPVLAVELHGMHGLCRYETPYYERDDVLIACGGVAAQLALLVLAWPLWYLLPLLSATVAGALRPTMSMLVWGNIVMIAFNLIPAPGLDGERAWKALPYGWEWLREYAQRRRRTAKRRTTLRAVPAAQPDKEQQMRELPDEPASADAAAAAARLLERLKGRGE